MSRSGYSYELDDLELGRWRAQVASATRGKRGQQCLREMLAALESMPDKRLIEGDLVDAEGEHCALGVLGAARGIDMTHLDPEEPEQVGAAFNIAPQLAQEIVFINDEDCRHETPEQRWASVTSWVRRQLRKIPDPPSSSEPNLSKD